MARSRSSVAGLAKLLDSAAAPIYFLDEERQIVFCNQACAAWVGIASEDLIGVQCSFHSSPDVSAAEYAAANLCPPPPVFAGERMHGEVCGVANQANAKRRAQFVPMLGKSGEVELVLAIVELPADSDDAVCDDDQLDATLHEAVRQFRQSQALRYRVDRLIGKSPAMHRAREQVAVAIESAASVFVTGATGTGKDHVAQTIHNRGGEPWGNLLPLACAALSADLLTSTLAAAVHGNKHEGADHRPTATLLLKDVDQLPVEAQAEFARLLQADRIALRLIATSSKTLDELLKSDLFRSDLALTLSTVAIDLPPLVERSIDLPALAQLFLEESNVAGGKQVGSLAPEALDLLAAYAWPGNLDELAAAVAEAHKAAQGVTIQPQDLPKSIRLAAEATPRSRSADDSIVLEDFLARVERELIERALARAKGNKTRAARLLGMTRPKLYRRLVQLKLV